MSHGGRQRQPSFFRASPLVYLPYARQPTHIGAPCVWYRHPHVSPSAERASEHRIAMRSDMAVTGHAALPERRTIVVGFGRNRPRPSARGANL